MVRNGSLLLLIPAIVASLMTAEAQNSIPPAPEKSHHNEKTADEKKEELFKIKEEINSLEKELQTKTKKEINTNSALENFSRQGFLLNKLINRLLREEQKKQLQITALQKEINFLEKEIRLIRENYAKYAVAVYKSGRSSEWAYIFNSASVQQAILRYKYLNEFSERRAKNISELHEKKERLVEEKNVLKKEIAEKEILSKQKQNEKNLLNAKLKERKKILNSIKRDKKVLADELKLKRNSEAKIKEMIRLLIEKAGPENEDLKIIRGNNIFLESVSFSSLKGSLTWPVSGGKIINNFGENRNKILNTVTVNRGIDIKPERDLSVKSVAGGIVSAVEWIPGYGSVIIITHDAEFRTVYGHLSEIFVEENETVKKGDIIAKIAEDIEGQILHFEIWSSRTNQDPEIWLAKK